MNTKVDVIMFRKLSEETKKKKKKRDKSLVLPCDCRFPCKWESTLTKEQQREAGEEAVGVTAQVTLVNTQQN